MCAGQAHDRGGVGGVVWRLNSTWCTLWGKITRYPLTIFRGCTCRKLGGVRVGEGGVRGAVSLIKTFDGYAIDVKARSTVALQAINSTVKAIT